MSIPSESFEGLPLDVLSLILKHVSHAISVVPHLESVLITDDTGPEPRFQEPARLALGVEGYERPS